MLNQLRLLNLVNKKSYHKFVPNLYKFNIINVRLGVLQCLLDSDGWIFYDHGVKCRIQYCSISKDLAEDVMFLVRSLGGYAFCNKREYSDKDSHEFKGHIIKHNYPAYIVDIKMDINPFKLSRKRDKFESNNRISKLISSIEECGEEECQCISVDAKDNLYLTNGFNLTHNSFHQSFSILDEAQNASFKQIKMFLTRMGKNTKMVINGDANQTDLHNSGLLECVDRLSGLENVAIIELKNEDIIRNKKLALILARLENNGQQT